MYPRREVPDALLRLATHQSGLVTLEQTLGHGLSRQTLTRLLRDDHWRRLATGLFSTVPVAPSWETLAWGGTLLGGPHARLGPEASGFLYDLVRKPPRPIDVLVPVAAPVRVQGPWRFVREQDGVRPARSPGSLPRLTPECTVLDLANVRSAGDVAGLLTVSVQRGLTNPERLREQLDARARQRHRELIAGMLIDVAAGVESYLEMTSAMACWWSSTARGGTTERTSSATRTGTTPRSHSPVRQPASQPSAPAGSGSRQTHPRSANYRAAQRSLPGRCSRCPNVPEADLLAA